MKFREMWKNLVGPGEQARLEPAPEVLPRTEHPQGYSADHPITSEAEDRFGRWPFAARIAETLATRVDPSSVVVGLYGPWGDGKTSTLRLMEQALSTHSNIVPVRFNPWYFSTQEALLRGFFDTLADAAGKRLTTNREQFGKFLKDYGGILSVASLTVGGVVTVSPGSAATGVGEDAAPPK